MDENPQDYEPERPGRLFYIGWIAAIVVAFCAMGGLVLAREFWIRSQTEERTQELSRGRRVLVREIAQSSTARDIKTPADIHGYIETPVYAKIPGYLKEIYIDKGDRVKKGQLLALLASPETDQQVKNDQADLVIKDLTNRRFQDMVVYDAASQQDADQAKANMLQSRATLLQAKAMQGYERIVADFDGIVTARNVDPGALVTQTTTSTGTNPIAIVSMATLSPLRVYAYVPQSTATMINNGDPATITVYEYPKKKFQGSITRHPEALNADTRTMLVEVDLPNDERLLYPGMYATMAMNLHGPAGVPLVPDDALIFRDNKTWVPIVKQNRLYVVPVSLGYDDGYNVEITEGLSGGEMVAMNVGQTAQDGETVQPMTAPPK
jgi:RND family efflux transporter MFP subunit